MVEGIALIVASLDEPAMRLRATRVRGVVSEKEVLNVCSGFNGKGGRIPASIFVNREWL